MKEDMIFTTKEIMEQIQLYGNIEWRSGKNLYMALYQNLWIQRVSNNWLCFEENTKQMGLSVL